MKLYFPRKETKYEVEDLNLRQEDCVKMIEIFVKSNLIDEAQEVFYEHLKDKDITVQSVKDALYFAVIGEQVVKIFKNVIHDFEKNPEEFKIKVNDFLEHKQDDSGE